MQREQMFDTYRAALATVAASKRARQRGAAVTSFQVRARLRVAMQPHFVCACGPVRLHDPGLFVVRGVWSKCAFTL